MIRDPREQSRQRAKWFWTELLTVLFVLTIAWFVDTSRAIDQAVVRAPATQSTEWAEKPATPRVEVNLPQVEMRAPIGTPAAGADRTREAPPSSKP